ncbi:hypothetical protein [Pseudomarimonas arenosa]|uniref:Uncharacterized protein n=1 Tax=Pseudomarimonas arenosa TaxID=2774145 RepID=A0AAW3ZJB9_9GAMM|nr:hypothetical protein [Pseudomarimonas arenosa]MBD8526078.1 hypothetical protein [Pseudomarimonas arenosa]
MTLQRTLQFLTLLLLSTVVFQVGAQENGKPLSRRVFQLMYEPIGGDWVPQVYVFNSAGVCVGVFGRPDPALIGAQVVEAIEKSSKACELTISDEFPGAAPTSNKQAVVQMIGLAGEAAGFCENCARTYSVLEAALKGVSGVRLDKLNLDLAAKEPNA